MQKKICFCSRLDIVGLIPYLRMIQLHIYVYGTTFEARREKITTTIDDNSTTSKNCWNKNKKSKETVDYFYLFLKNERTFLDKGKVKLLTLNFIKMQKT